MNKSLHNYECYKNFHHFKSILLQIKEHKDLFALSWALRKATHMYRRQTFILIKDSSPDSLLLSLIRPTCQHPELFDLIWWHQGTCGEYGKSHVCYEASVASARKKCKHSHISGKRTSNSDGSKSAQRRANMSHEFRHWNWPPTSDTRSWLCVWCHKSVWEVDRRRGEGISEKRKCGKPKANERTLRGKQEKDRKCKGKRRTGGERLMQEGEKCVGCTPDANINVCVAGYNMSIQTGIYMTWIWRYFCLCCLHLWI